MVATLARSIQPAKAVSPAKAARLPRRLPASAYWPAWRLCERCGGWLYVYDHSPKLGIEWACLACGARRYETPRTYQRRASGR